MYGGFDTIISNFSPLICSNKFDSINSTFELFNTLFFSATSKAFVLTSLANTCVFRILLNEIAIAPLPVHKSKILKLWLLYLLQISSTVSTSISVSGCGISTSSFTKNSIPINSCFCVIYWSGFPSIICSMYFVNSAYSVSVRAVSEFIVKYTLSFFRTYERSSFAIILLSSKLLLFKIFFASSSACLIFILQTPFSNLCMLIWYHKKI